jgi:hypothetical protein
MFQFVEVRISKVYEVKFPNTLKPIATTNADQYQLFLIVYVLRIFAQALLACYIL